MVDRILAANGVQPTFSVRPHFLASNLTVELPAYVRTNNFHVPGMQKTKPVLRTQYKTNKKAVVVLGRERMTTNGYLKTKFTRI